MTDCYILVAFLVIIVRLKLFKNVLLWCVFLLRCMRTALFLRENWHMLQIWANLSFRVLLAQQILSIIRPTTMMMQTKMVMITTMMIIGFHKGGWVSLLLIFIVSILRMSIRTISIRNVNNSLKGLKIYWEINLQNDLYGQTVKTERLEPLLQ